MVFISFPVCYACIISVSRTRFLNKINANNIPYRGHVHIRTKDLQKRNAIQSAKSMCNAMQWSPSQRLRWPGYPLPRAFQIPNKKKTTARQNQSVVQWLKTFYSFFFFTDQVRVFSFIYNVINKQLYICTKTSKRQARTSGITDF